MSAKSMYFYVDFALFVHKIDFLINSSGFPRVIMLFYDFYDLVVSCPRIGEIERRGYKKCDIFLIYS